MLMEKMHFFMIHGNPLKDETTLEKLVIFFFAIPATFFN